MVEGKAKGPEGFELQFVFGERRSCSGENLPDVFSPHRLPGLLLGIVALLQVSPYAPTEASVGGFLADVVRPDPLGALRHGLFVFLKEDEVVAFLQARILFEDAEIDYVAVSGAHRNRGLGRALLVAFEEEAATLGAGRLVLEVGEKNIAARQMYKSFGFEPMARRENYYHGREAALVLEKPL